MHVIDRYVGDLRRECWEFDLIYNGRSARISFREWQLQSRPTKRHRNWETEQQWKSGNAPASRSHPVEPVVPRDVWEEAMNFYISDITDSLRTQYIERYAKEHANA